MSDGPHKSLNMRRHWREFSRVVSNPAHTLDEASQALRDAMLCDERGEALGALIRKVEKVIYSCANDMFADPTAAIKQLSQDTDGVLSRLFLENFLTACNCGSTSTALLNEALGATRTDWICISVRGIEEHFLREGFGKPLSTLRNRLHEVTHRITFEGISPGELPSGSVSRKQTGLDEGVEI